MKISLVLPVYNRLQYMADALGSLIRQTVPPSEIILVDDGSTDGSLDGFVDTFQALRDVDSRVPELRCIRLERDGVYRNSSYPYNVGIRQATGDVVVYCAAELIHFPRNFEYIRDAMQANPGVFLIGGSIFFEAEYNRLPDNVRVVPALIWNESFDVWHPEYYGNDRKTMLLWDSISGVHAVYRQHLLDVRGFEESLTSWGHNDGHMRRRMLELKGLQEFKCPQIITIHPWHPRPPQPNMQSATAHYDIARQSGLVANLGRDWGIIDGAHS